VIHRDIKPGNLLFARDGTVKLSDFGIARLFGQARMTGAGSVLGTAEYMAPEQASGQPVDVRTDLFSLGGVLYALLTRRPPVSGESMVAILQFQQSVDPIPVGTLAPATPPALQAIIMQLLSKDPDARFATATALAHRLQAVLDEATAAGAALMAQSPAPAKPISTAPAAAAAPESQVRSLPDTSPMTRSDWLPPVMPIPVVESAPVEPRNAIPARSEIQARSASEGTGEGANHGTGDAPTAEHRLPPPAAPPPPAQFVRVHKDELDAVAAPREDGSWISLQTWLLLAGLLAIVAVVWYATRPVSADTLHARIEARSGDNDAREADINDFLKRFPDDSRVAQLRQYQQDIELARQEDRYEKRASGLLRNNLPLPIERDYVDAIQASRLNLAQGEAKLQAILDLYGHRTGNSDATARCLTLVTRRLASIREQIQAQAKLRLEFLRGRLQEARDLRARDPARAAEICRAIVVLYGDKPWAAAEVRQAEQLLAELRKGVSFKSVPCPRLPWACFAANMLAVSLRSPSKHGTHTSPSGNP
jgi:serine/threonine-protein kinase